MGAERHLGVLLSFGCFVVLLLLLFVCLFFVCLFVCLFFFFLGGAFFLPFFCFCLMMGWGGAGWDVNVYVHVTLMMLR